MPETAKCNTSSVKEKYLNYYEFITNIYPHRPIKGGYDGVISSLIKDLPSEFLLHTKGNNPVGIDSLRSAKKLWDEAVSIDYKPEVSDKDKSFELEYYLFNKNEFKPSFTMIGLCKAILRDCDSDTIKRTPKKIIDWLNELLKTPNLYDTLCAKIPDNVFKRSKEFHTVRGSMICYEEESYRDRKFSDLSEGEQAKLIKFNRSVLKRLYLNEYPQMPSWWDRDIQRTQETARKKVEIYLLSEHKEHLESLEPKSESTPEKQKRKLPRGKKKPYANTKEYTEFLQSINNKCNGNLSQKTNMAISEMVGRELFLDGNARPIYTKNTIKKHLSQLKKDHIFTFQFEK